VHIVSINQFNIDKSVCVSVSLVHLLHCPQYEDINQREQVCQVVVSCLCHSILWSKVSRSSQEEWGQKRNCSVWGLIQTQVKHITIVVYGNNFAVM